MKLIKIENKISKLKLDKTVTEESVNELLDELSMLYGNSAVGDYKIGEIVASAEQAVDTLEIEIHSAGGSVLDGYRLYNQIKSLRERGVYVVAKINTLAASMASVLAMAADKIVMYSNSRMMIHEASAGIYGNSDDFAKVSDQLDEISDDIAGIYASKSGRDKDEIRNLMRKETWMNAKEALEMNFIDEILDTKPSLMKNLFDKFKPDAELKEKVQGLEASILDAENKYSELNTEFENRGIELQNAVTELTEFKNKYNELETKFQEISNKVAEKENLISEKETEIEDLKNEVKTVKASASGKAVEILASVGHSTLEVDASEGEDGILTREKINKISDVNKRIEARKKNWNKLNK